jgi:hypothetical protein
MNVVCCSTLLLNTTYCLKFCLVLNLLQLPHQRCCVLGEGKSIFLRSCNITHYTWWCGLVWLQIVWFALFVLTNLLSLHFVQKVEMWLTAAIGCLEEVWLQCDGGTHLTITVWHFEQMFSGSHDWLLFTKIFHPTVLSTIQSWSNHGGLLFWGLEGWGGDVLSRNSWVCRVVTSVIICPELWSQHSPVL